MPDLLVVDDDLELGDMLADLLREDGYDVRIARNGQDGLAQVRARRPDAAVLDVEMPVLTGPEMAYAMFLHDLGLEEVPIVLVSGILDLKSVAAAVGTPYFVAKPYAMDHIRAIVRKALDERVPPHPQLQVAATAHV